MASSPVVRLRRMSSHRCSSGRVAVVIHAHRYSRGPFAPGPQLCCCHARVGYPLGEVVDAYEGAAVVDVHASVASDREDVADPAVFQVVA